MIKIVTMEKRPGDGFNTPTVFIEFFPRFLTDHEIWAEQHRDETFWHY